MAHGKTLNKTIYIACEDFFKLRYTHTIIGVGVYTNRYIDGRDNTYDVQLEIYDVFWGWRVYHKLYKYLRKQFPQWKIYRTGYGENESIRIVPSNNHGIVYERNLKINKILSIIKKANN